MLVTIILCCLINLMSYTNAICNHIFLRRHHIPQQPPYLLRNSQRLLLTQPPSNNLHRNRSPMVRLGIILLLHLGIHLIQRLIPLLLRIEALIRKRNGHNGAREIEQVDHRRVAVVLEAVVADGGGGRDGCDYGVQGLVGAEAFFG